MCASFKLRIGLPGEETDADVVNIHSVSSSQKARCVSLPFLGCFPVLLFISQWYDQDCGSRISDPDQTTAPKEEGGKLLFYHIL
jgi:hypothetical protein